MKKFIMLIMIAALMIPGIVFADATAYSDQTQNQEQNSYTNANSSASQGQSINVDSHDSVDVDSHDKTNSNATQGQTTVVGVGELIKNSFNSGPSKRGFAIPNDIHFPGTPSYFGKAIPSFQFQSVNTLLMYKSVFSITELKTMASGKGKATRIISTLVNSGYINKDESIDTADINKDDFTYMVIYITKPKINVDLVGYVTAASKSKNGVSIKTVAQAALAAHEMGANIIHISAEGAERKLTTNGWGIGFNQTHSTINGGGENTGNVSSGGTGYSSGTAGYRDLPWIQVFCLYGQVSEAPTTLKDRGFFN